MFTLICARIIGWVNNREAGDLRRYRAHYDVIVMGHCSHRTMNMMNRWSTSIYHDIAFVYWYPDELLAKMFLVPKKQGPSASKLAHIQRLSSDALYSSFRAIESIWGCIAFALTCTPHGALMCFTSGPRDVSISWRAILFLGVYFVTSCQCSQCSPFTSGTYLSSYPGYSREPHWFSMGPPEIFRLTWQAWVSVSKPAEFSLTLVLMEPVTPSNPSNMIGSLADVSVKFLGEWISLNPNLVASRLHEIKDDIQIVDTPCMLWHCMRF